MAERINFRSFIRKITAPQLRLLGYEEIKETENNKGITTTLFRKHLYGDIYAFVEFQLGRWVSIIPPIPRTFDVALIRNKGNIPDTIGINRDEKYIMFPLSILLWNVLGVQKYGSPQHWWKYSNVYELETQLNMVNEDLTEYAIPWIEDEKSTNVNPYRKET